MSATSRRSGYFVAALLLSALFARASEPAPWIPDRGDGSYRNPVLHADYSDPDAIRVGDDFWLTSSSFSHVPGLPILHSRDLVNWELVNHALPELVPVEHFRQVRHGEGVWAPAIRYHAGKFRIYYPDPDFGIYVVTATDPRGRWSAPELVMGGKGLIDPCPFWDDDGQAYLIHAWAHSRGPVANRLSLVKLNSDGTRALDAGKDVIDGNQMPGWRTIEGPKLYKRNGYYYVFAPAGGVTEGYQAVFRSKEIYGPYENRIVLEKDGTPVNGPHQGAWVDTASGEDWFLHFQDKGAFGRVVHLEPMVWRDDGWPAMGTATDTGAEKGAPVLTHRKPAVRDAASSRPVAVPPTSDEFEGASLGLQWQWQANPQSDWYSLAARRGWIRLHAEPAPGDDLYDSPNLLLQKFPAPEFTVTTCLDGSGLAPGDAAGLMVFGYSYAWIGLRRDARGLRLVHAVNHHHDTKFGPSNFAHADEAVLEATTPRVFLRVAVNSSAKCQFSYSTDGATFTPLSVGPAFEATVGRWVGAKVGVFAVERGNGNRTEKAGYADFDRFGVAR
jgi:beta-xylosidase